MIFNINGEIPNFSRYNGGWIKTIVKIDKDYKNGYSLVGEFLPVSQGNIDLDDNILYLDCSIDGSRKNQIKNYTLFKTKDGKVEILYHIEDGGADWAMSLWDVVESELGTIEESRVETVFNQIQSLSADERELLFQKINHNRKLRTEFSKKISISPKKLISFTYDETIEFLEKFRKGEHDKSYDDCWLYVVVNSLGDNVPSTHNIQITEKVSFSVDNNIKWVKEDKSEFIEAFIIDSDEMYIDAWLFCEPELLQASEG